MVTLTRPSTRRLKFALDRPIGPDISVEKHRETFATLGRRLNKKIKGQVEITPIRAGQAQAEWIEIPDAMPHRVLLYLHGGGYVLGSAETYRSLVVRLCQAAQARALVVDYRLAPEHRFPAALEDTVDCYRWLLKQGVDPRGLAIVGDGSGGGLAMSTCMGLQVAEAQQPAALVALSPWTDLALTSWSIFTRAETDPMYPFETLAVFARLYLNGRSPAEPMASPFYGDFRGLPPMLVHCGSDEILRDDATRIAAKAERAGVDISVEVWDKMPHLFQLDPHISEAKGALSRIASFIKARTHSDG